jgi:hypothetical protein
MELRINIVELASELAHKDLTKMVYNESELFEDPEAGITNYTDYYQDIFNELYDEYYTIIEQCKQ